MRNLRIAIREVVLAYAVLSDVRMFIRSSIVVMSKLTAVAGSNYIVSLVGTLVSLQHVVQYQVHTMC